MYMIRIGNERSTGIIVILHGNQLHYERLFCTLQYYNAVIHAINVTSINVTNTFLVRNIV
jgi:hypothetical protein